MGYHPAIEAMLDKLTPASRACEAVVERTTDAKIANRTIIRITGRTKEAVQRQINLLMFEIEESGGFANFIGPEWMRDRRGFIAEGEMLKGPWV